MDCRCAVCRGAALDRDVVRHVNGPHQCIVLFVGSPGPTTWAYTIGLKHNFSAPELIVFSLPAKTAHGVIMTVVQAYRTGFRPDDGLETGAVGPTPLAFRAVHPTQLPAFMGRGLDFNGSFDAAQIVWPSKEGLFPWDEGTSAAYRRAQEQLWKPNFGVVGAEVGANVL